MLIITHRMSEPIVEWVGSSCGKHGAYTFYKGFKLTANGTTRNYLLGEFYFIRSSKDRPICIAEFQLLWHDANTDNKLASARLYFRPESVPGGRRSCHGKDELLCTDEKVVIKCKDMMSLEYEGTGWSYGMKAISELNLHEVPNTGNMHSEDSEKKFRLLKRKSKTKKVLAKERAKMVILSFSAYCRFKSLVKKLASGVVLTKIAIKAFGGVVQCNDCTWVSFSRETFHHPGLAKFDMFMLNKAPVLKGRPRKKKASKSTSSKEELKVQQNIATVGQQASNEVESSDDNHTDTSETSSIQELPCPPKLVTKVKEEKPTSVIRSVKQSVEIPPVPKLVKIEPKDSIPYGHYSDPSLIYTDRKSDQIEKNIPLKGSYSTSTIVSSQYRDDRKTNQVTFGTQAREKSIKVEKDSSPAILPANTLATLVSHAATITTNHVQPRISTIMSTTLATQGEVTQNLATSNGNEARAEQPLKRKRGRPPGKSNKCLKSSEMKIAPKTVEEVQIKDEDGHGCTETLMEAEEYSPEPQNAEEREFMKNLKIFMRKRGSPIEKIPALGFRKINLFKMYEVTQALGGYDQVTSKRLWRRVYSEVGGAPSITSAATNSRKHYEKLLLPYERYSRGEDYMVDLKLSEIPSPTPEGLVSPRKDQNANVVPHNETVVISQPVAQSVLSKPDIPPVSRIMQTNQYENRLKPTGVISHQDTRLKPVLTSVTNQWDSRPTVTDVRSQQEKLLQATVTVVRSQQDTRSKSAMTGSVGKQDTHLKAGVSEIRSHQDTRLKTATTSVISKQESRLKPVLTSVMNLQNTPSKPKVTAVFNQQESRSKPVLTDSRSQQDARLKLAITDVRSQQNELFITAVSRAKELGEKNMSNPAHVMVQDERQNVSCITSLKAQHKRATTNTSHQDRTVVSHNIERTQYTKPLQQDRRSVVYTQHQYNKTADSPIEFITAGSRSSPVMLYSTNADERSIRYTTFEPQNIRHTSRSSGSNERVSTPESSRSNKKEYITENYPEIYARQNKTESRMTEFERKPKYLSRVDQINDFGIAQDYHAEESRDIRRHARSSGDEILLTNVIPSKRAHSPHDVIYSVPVYQPSHYPHSGFELYDLPNTAFPVRASSRIFMPSHQVFPGPGHPAFSPYTPHIIATIGADPTTLYPLPMPGYYPQELAYPMDTGVQILHS